MKKQEMKRHCMIVHGPYPHTETRVEREAQALIRYGHEVDVICLKDSPDEPSFAIADGVNVHRLPVQRDKRRGLFGQLLEYLSFFVLAFFKVNELYNKRKYGVVEVHNLPDFLVFAALWPKMRGARVILNIHDVMPEFYAARFKKDMNSLPVRLVRWQEAISCRFADHVITVTEPWRQSLIERGVPAEKVSVVMNVANNQIFNGGEAGQPHDRESRFALIYHGTLAQRYGIDLLLRAVAIARKAIPEIHLTVHGRGEYYENLVELAKELGLEKEVSFSTGLLPISDLPAFIRRADLGVVPYRRDVFTDGILPTKLMEYTALHVPVIAARTPAIEAYFDEDMVHYVPAEDVEALAAAIVYLHEHRGRLNELAAKSNRFNERFAWENIAQGYSSLVERLPAS